MSILTVRGIAPLNLSIVALAIGGVPVAPPMRPTALCRSDTLSSMPIACTPIRNAPASFMVRLIGPAWQHDPDAALLPAFHKSQTTGPLSGSTAGKLIETTVPTGPLVGETLNAPDGGSPRLDLGHTVAYATDFARHPVTSATQPDNATEAVG